MDNAIQQAVGLLESFTEKEQKFALNVLKQIPQRQIDDDSYVCEFGYVHGAFNDESKEAFEECEEIIRRIEAGDRSGCMSLDDFLKEVESWAKEDDDVRDSAFNQIQAAV